MRIVGVILLVLVSLFGEAQNTFQKIYKTTNYYDWLSAIESTSDSGFIFSGYHWLYTGQPQGISITKTNHDGQIEWSKHYNAQENTGWVRQTADGGYILTAGRAISPWGNSDLYLLKVSSNGTIQWNRTYGDSAVWTETGYAVDQLDDKGYIIAGFAGRFGAGLEDAYLIRTDSVGDNYGQKLMAQVKTNVHMLCKKPMMVEL